MKVQFNHLSLYYFVDIAGVWTKSTSYMYKVVREYWRLKLIFPQFWGDLSKFFASSNITASRRRTCLVSIWFFFQIKLKIPIKHFFKGKLSCVCLCRNRDCFKIITANCSKSRHNNIFKFLSSQTDAIESFGRLPRYCNRF